MAGKLTTAWVSGQPARLAVSVRAVGGNAYCPPPYYSSLKIRGDYHRSHIERLSYFCHIRCLDSRMMCERLRENPYASMAYSGGPGRGYCRCRRSANPAFRSRGHGHLSGACQLGEQYPRLTGVAVNYQPIGSGGGTQCGFQLSTGFQSYVQRRIGRGCMAYHRHHLNQFWSTGMARPMAILLLSLSARLLIHSRSFVK